LEQGRHVLAFRDLRRQAVLLALANTIGKNESCSSLALLNEHIENIDEHLGGRTYFAIDFVDQTIGFTLLLQRFSQNEQRLACSIMPSRRAKRQTTIL
jgi:hypothetical protein